MDRTLTVWWNSGDFCRWICGLGPRESEKRQKKVTLKDRRQNILSTTLEQFEKKPKPKPISYKMPLSNGNKWELSEILGSNCFIPALKCILFYSKKDSGIQAPDTDSQIMYPQIIYPSWRLSSSQHKVGPCLHNWVQVHEHTFLGGTENETKTYVVILLKLSQNISEFG